MSHFTVLVVGDVEEQLAPFHEFECTGKVDEFVVDVDLTEKVRESYEDPSNIITMMVGPGGERRHRYDSLFERREEKDGDLLARTHYDNIPEGWSELSLPAAEMMTFSQFAHQQHGYPSVCEGETPDIHGAHKWGYLVRKPSPDGDGEVIRVVSRTNPNAKWDWYVTGGRWTGFFQLKPGAMGRLGRPGVMMKRPTEPGRADSAKKRDIDIEAMLERHREKAREAYDLFMEHTTEEARDSFVPWKAMLNESGYDDAPSEDQKEIIKSLRKSHRGQPLIQQISAHKDLRWVDEPEEYLVEREEFAEARALQSIRCFAILKDRVWREKGDMGWWGMVADERTEEDWSKEYWSVWDSIDEDEIVTIVDCHI